MPKSIQLHIPTPCHEDWKKMTPSEQGRHCTACQKTVVDLTMMSDTEIIKYMRQARSGVCGRLAADQLNRPLVPLSPVQRNGGKGWPWLLAGLMFTIDGAICKDNVTMGMMMTPPEQKVDSTGGRSVGMIGTSNIMDGPPVDTVAEGRVDTAGEVMGEVVIKGQKDTSDVIMADTLMPSAWIDTAEDVINGGITLVINDVVRSNPVDTVKQFVKDTLTALRILPKEERLELKVFPNPVSRGSLLHIAWQTEPGEYSVSLFTTGGALIRTRVMQVGNSSQMDAWEVPGGLAAGVYILRALRSGQTGGFTQKVVVE